VTVATLLLIVVRTKLRRVLNNVTSFSFVAFLFHILFSQYFFPPFTLPVINYLTNCASFTFIPVFLCNFLSFTSISLMFYLNYWPEVGYTFPHPITKHLSTGGPQIPDTSFLNSYEFSITLLLLRN
jgi:hypothetical protein